MICFPPVALVNKYSCNSKQRKMLRLLSFVRIKMTVGWRQGKYSLRIWCLFFCSWQGTQTSLIFLVLWWCKVSVDPPIVSCHYVAVLFLAKRNQTFLSLFIAFQVVTRRLKLSSSSEFLFQFMSCQTIFPCWWCAWTILNVVSLQFYKPAVVQFSFADSFPINDLLCPANTNNASSFRHSSLVTHCFVLLYW